MDESGSAFVVPHDTMQRVDLCFVDPALEAVYKRELGHGVFNRLHSLVLCFVTASMPWTGYALWQEEWGRARVGAAIIVVLSVLHHQIHQNYAVVQGEFVVRYAGLFLACAAPCAVAYAADTGRVTAVITLICCAHAMSSSVLSLPFPHFVFWNGLACNSGIAVVCALLLAPDASESVLIPAASLTLFFGFQSRQNDRDRRTAFLHERRLDEADVAVEVFEAHQPFLHWLGLRKDKADTAVSAGKQIAAVQTALLYANAGDWDIHIEDLELQEKVAAAGARHNLCRAPQPTNNH
jgi:hypothetical protein